MKLPGEAEDWDGASAIVGGEDEAVLLVQQQVAGASSRAAITQHIGIVSRDWELLHRILSERSEDFGFTEAYFYVI